MGGLYYRTEVRGLLLELSPFTLVYALNFSVNYFGGLEELAREIDMSTTHRIFVPLFPLFRGGLCRVTALAPNTARGRSVSVSFLSRVAGGGFQDRRNEVHRGWGLACLAGVAGIGVIVYEWRGRGSSVQLLPELQAAEDKEEKVARRPWREVRYEDFASFNYMGEPYMSARDFLESLTQDRPRRE